jgi:cytochrome P450
MAIHTLALCNTQTAERKKPQVMLYILVALIVAAALYGVMILIDAERKRIKMNCPNVAGGVPLFGQAFKMLAGSPWDLMNDWAKQYGAVFSFYLFGSNAIAVHDPEVLKVILQTKVHVFRKDLDWVYKPFLVILGNGIVTSHGESWRKQRTLLSHTLRIDILDVIPDMAIRATRRLAEKLDQCCKTGETIDMAEEFRHLTLQVIAEAVLSISPEESDETFAHMYLPIVEEGNLRTWSPQRAFLPTPAFFKHQTDVKRLNDYVVSLVTARWALRQKEAAADTPASRTQDVLDKVLSAVDPAEWGTKAINQVRDEVKTFILAGHETSASMLTWTLFELSSTPALLETFRASTSQVFGKQFAKAGASTASCMTIPDDLAKLNDLYYSECCLRESLRKYAVVPSVVRVPSEDVEINGHVISKGTSVMINVMAAHHDEAHWPENTVYKPDRFINGMASIKPYTFLPFVDGPRHCLGQYLSLLESKVVISLLLHHYSFDVVDPKEAGKTHPFMVPIIPNTGHVMKVTRRSSA